MGYSIEVADHTFRRSRIITMGGLGQHLLADLYGCTFAALDDLEGLRAAVLEAARRSGATLLSDHFRRFEPHGVTGVVIVAESHLSVHSWPEHGYLALDYFTCGERVDMQAALQSLVADLSPASVSQSVHWRGEQLAGARPHPGAAPSDKRTTSRP